MATSNDGRAVRCSGRVQHRLAGHRRKFRCPGKMASMADSKSERGLSRSSIEAYGGILVGIAAVVIPSWWAQAVLILIAAGLAIHLSLQAPIMLRRGLLGRIGISIFSAVLILGGGGTLAHRQYLKENPSAASTADAAFQTVSRKNLHDLFVEDFPNGVKIEQDYVFGVDKKRTTVQLKRVLDFDAGSKYIAFYMPVSELALSIFYTIADHTNELVNPKYGVVNGQRRSPGDPMAVKISEMKFSGLVYLYSDLTPSGCFYVAFHTQRKCLNSPRAERRSQSPLDDPLYNVLRNICWDIEPLAQNAPVIKKLMNSVFVRTSEIGDFHLKQD